MNKEPSNLVIVGWVLFTLGLAGVAVFGMRSCSQQMYRVQDVHNQLRQQEVNECTRKGGKLLRLHRGREVCVKREVLL